MAAQQDVHAVVPPQDAVMGFDAYSLILEKLNHIDNKVNRLENELSNFSKQILSKITESEIKQGKRRKKDLPQEQAGKINECLGLIRSEVKERLPDFPTFEKPVDKMRIKEVEILLKENPTIQEAMHLGLINEASLHNSVISCLAEQRRSPARAETHQKKRKMTGEISKSSLDPDSDMEHTSSVDFEVKITQLMHHFRLVRRQQVSVGWLQEELRKRNIDSSGSKYDLINRLYDLALEESKQQGPAALSQQDEEGVHAATLLVEASQQ